MEAVNQTSRDKERKEEGKLNEEDKWQKWQELMKPRRALNTIRQIQIPNRHLPPHH